MSPLLAHLIFKKKCCNVSKSYLGEILLPSIPELLLLELELAL